MSLYSALPAVAEAVFGTLQDATLASLATGGIFTDVPPNPAFPLVLFEIAERPIGGFGTAPGPNQLSEVTLTVHVYSEYGGYLSAETIMDRVIELLRSPITVTDYGSWAIFYDDTSTVADELLAGVKVKEIVAHFRLFVESGTTITSSGASDWIQAGWTQ
jgi:hypothetical protein